MAVIIPAATPPAVSTENDLPGMNSLAERATESSLIKVNPDSRQKGSSTINVKIMLARNEGVSPGLKKNLDMNKRSRIDIKGDSEKIRLIFLKSFIVDLAAIAEPIADPISHDPRNVPDISSYPPEMFIISLNRRNWKEELTKPRIKRLTAISPEVNFSGISVII
jgi:hypothetical protein